ncbi:GH92 family glycosyl hydrolase [Luteimicrobium sp. DT211]|uniref:GH92 family glycosyl hydrolase n=1 Tax=Luteimicrobium sp. DT211 TaxID=3393412 RepID=UPI003CF5F9EE
MRRTFGIVAPVAALVLAGGGALVGAPTAQAAAGSPVADPASYVNPFIGTQDEGNTYPGATVPFGMVQLSPDTGHNTGYDYTQNSIRGFSQVHLSGVGCGLGGFVPILPTTGDVTKTDDAAYALGFSHDDEAASPGSYEVGLAAPGGTVKAELTATAHTGVQRYTFPSTTKADVLVDAGQALSGVSSSSVKITGDRTVETATTVHGFCQDTKPFTVYTRTTFSRPFTASGTWTGDTVTAGSVSASSTQRTGAYLQFDTTGSGGDARVVEAQTSLSYVDADGAAANLAAEASGFDTAKAAATKAWDDRLGQVAVTSSDTSDAGKTRLKTFYSALYRTFLAPNTGTDVDQRYRGWDGDVHTADGFTYYQDFSLWDTYRTQQQLLSLLAPEQSADMAYSVVLEGEQGGWAPRWSYGPVETNIMTGDPVTPFLVDAWSQGLLKGHEEEAYAVLKQNADGVPPASSPSNGRAGNATYLADGYVPYEPSATGKPGDYDLQHGGSATLEYALADASLSAMAQGLGHADDAARYADRAQSFRSIWDSTTKSFRARGADGLFVAETDPASAPGFHEGTAVQYQWLVPQDMPALVDLMGGKDAAEQRLDAFFAYDKVLADPADTAKNVWVSGSYDYYNQDKYNPNNEPDLASPYSYLWTGQPWKTTDVVRAALTLFTDGPTGVTGNDDLGEMSAWDVASSLGIYPIQPGADLWGLSTPAFDRVDIALDRAYYPAGNLTITADGVSDSSHYVQSLTSDGGDVDRAYLTGPQLTSAGTLAYTVGSKPSAWATGADAAPGALVSGASIPDRLTAGVSVPAVYGTPGGDVTLPVAVLAQGSGTRHGTVSATSKDRSLRSAGAEPWSVTADGGAAQTSVDVTVHLAPDTAFGNHEVKVAVRDADGTVIRDTVQVVVAGDSWLQGAFNNAGIADRGKAGSGDFDGLGWAYLRDEMAGAGLWAGGEHTVPGTDLTYVLGGATTGPDNVVGSADPATTDVSAALGKAHQIAFVGAGASGNQTGDVTLGFADGSTQKVAVTLTDWCSGSPAQGNVLVGRTAHRSSGGGTGTDSVACGLFATDAVALPAGKHLASLTWSTNTKLHVFAVASDARPAAVTARKPVKVTGDARPGSTVHAVAPTWNAAGTATTYRWSVDGTTVAGASGADYTVRASDVGKALAVTAVGRADGYLSGSVTSAPVRVRPAVITAKDPVWISGDVVVGGKLTIHPGTYDVADPSFAYSWFADGHRIAGADQGTFVLGRAQAGKRITAEVVVSAPGHADLRVTTGRTVPVAKR